MDFMTSMKISSSGLTVQRKRIETISSNMANMETTRTPEGGPYRRKDLVITAMPLRDEFGRHLKQNMSNNLRQVTVTEIVEDQNEPRMQFDPDHPDANELGYVAYPNIDLMSEMVNLMSASRTYEANATALNASKTLAIRAIDLGR
tara:strand:- start:2 stop:439 length:438 start_codon:yes stop_codon:yes gene_type:complete